MKSTDTSNIHLLERVIVYGANGTTIRVSPNRPVSLIVCSVKIGAVAVWFGSNALGLVPDLWFGQVNRPVALPIPCGQYEFLVVASDPFNATQATVTFGGP